MEDHPLLQSDGRTDLIITEVKKGLCHLNGPWTNPERRNMRRVLYALGAFPEEQVEAVARALYEERYYEDDQYRFRLFAMGSTQDRDLSAPVVQITWGEILRFIHDRFRRYKRYKTQHQQWDDTGRELFRLAIYNRNDPEVFVETALERLGP